MTEGRLLLAVARFELRYHAREFLTWLAALVFLLLTFGFTASGLVELVGDRGALPRNAPWVVAHATAGVTAFGQVITTMIAATAVLRDDAARTRELLLATRLTRTAYVGGRFAGAVAVMLLVYLAIPLGALLGTLAPWVPAGALAPFDAGSYARPWLLLAVPNVLVVTALLFAAGTRGGRLMVILLVALGLVALWQAGLTLTASPATRTAGALLDPFGSAALAATTAEWSAAERAVRPLPWGGPLLANRALWLAIGVAVAAWALATYRLVLVPAGVGRRSEPDAPSSPAPAPAPAAAAAARPLPPAAQLRATARFTARWTVGERGFVVLATLALLNAAANAWGAAPDGSAAVRASVELHSRIFLILIATIYAGELVWRERDLRADALYRTLPLRRGALVLGRAIGVAAAEAVLVAALLAAALVVQLRAPDGPDVAAAFAWAGGTLLPTVVQLTLLSLAVHAVVRHKVVAHLLLIAAWAAAVAAHAAIGEPWLVQAALAPGSVGTPAAWGWAVAVAAASVGGAGAAELAGRASR